MRAHKRWRNRREWMREWVRDRSKLGAYHQLVQGLCLSDEASYRHFLCMDVATFDELLTMVGAHIAYQLRHKNIREAIWSGERLALTLCFLATGQLTTSTPTASWKTSITTSSLYYLQEKPTPAYSTCTAQTIGRIVPETCTAIILWSELQQFLQV